MKFHNVEVKQFYRQEAWADVTGLSVSVVRNDKKQQSFHNEEDIQESFNSAWGQAETIALAMKQAHGYKEQWIYKNDSQIVVAHWVSIGD